MACSAQYKDYSRLNSMRDVGTRTRKYNNIGSIQFSFWESKKLVRFDGYWLNILLMNLHATKISKPVHHLSINLDDR